MRQMFHSATIKLTAWYLLIMMIISVTFSATIYQLTMGELSYRFSNLQSEVEHVPRFDLPNNFFGQLRESQNEDAHESLITKLIYTNLVILGLGGLASYFLARRTLRPIEIANETQMQFVSDASHELRTPLAVLKVELETALRDSKLTKEEMREILVSNLEEVDTLSGLSHTLLQLSQFDQTNSKLDTTSFSLNDTIQNVIDRHSKTTSRIVFESSVNLKARAHEPSINELVAILIDNALKYSPEDTNISIELKPQGKYIVFTIANSGPGIKLDDMPHIFDRFFRADSSRTKQTKTHGYGLGLSLAKRIVELNNGELSATSTPDGITEFTVALPTDTKSAHAKNHNKE